jgi:hypothetical protein
MFNYPPAIATTEQAFNQMSYPSYPPQRLIGPGPQSFSQPTSFDQRFNTGMFNNPQAIESPPATPIHSEHGLNISHLSAYDHARIMDQIAPRRTVRGENVQHASEEEPSAFESIKTLNNVDDLYRQRYDAPANADPLNRLPLHVLAKKINRQHLGYERQPYSQQNLSYY